MRKLIPILILIAACLCSFIFLFTIPSQAARIYGPPAAWLILPQRIQYSAQLLWYDGLLTRPLNVLGNEQNFTIDLGESANSVAVHLYEAGLIRDPEAFRAYLIYSGLDTSIQAGSYKLSASSSAIDIAHKLQDATSAEVTFVILPGWRAEEIAASLPTSGLPVAADEFVAAVHTPSNDYDFLIGTTSMEGFLFPDSYVISRTTSAEKIVAEFVRNFALHLSIDMRNGFEKQGLTIYQAVTLASIVEREAVHDEEKPIIASVYLNRLRIKMKLDADPTVQYALGYDFVSGTWWKNPLSLDDLKYDSPFNTYTFAGLPPAPIANPSLKSLQAVAFPAETPYYYFRAKCDDSGYHAFAATFDEQMANGCP
jgi:UPF0755 protein